MADDTPEPDRVPGYPHPRETRVLFGQEAAERAFLAAWADGRLHHGWLIRGPRGIGKATLAYRIARALIAGEPSGPGGRVGGAENTAPASLEAPEGCPVARRIAAQGEARLRVLRRSVNPETGRMRTQIVVADVREVRRFLHLSMPDGGWRVVIVDPADELNRSAANALLKVLEEPPPETALLLVSHAPGRLLPTIRSRCRSLELRPLGPGPLRRALEGTGLRVAPGEAAALAILAGGSVGEALRIAAGGGAALYARIVAALGQGRGVVRAEMSAIADQATGRAAQEVLDLTARLILTLLGRLARHAAAGGGDSEDGPEAAPGEAALMAAVARAPAQAALWAEAASRIGAALAHARTVNLDPGLTIIDTFLDLDATLARAREAA